MAYLLDTHILIWWLAQDEKYATKIQEVVEDATKKVFVSTASVWEISIKKSKGKLKTPDDLEAQLYKHNFTPLPVALNHALLVEELPWHHNDPFDRMLVAQALSDGLEIVTHDKKLALYEAKTLLI